MTGTGQQSCPPTVLFEFGDAVMETGFMLGRILHESRERGVAQFRRAPHRDLIFAEQFQRKQLRRFLGQVTRIEPANDGKQRGR